MPNRKVKLILNPNADLGRAWHKAADLRPVIEEFGGADWSGTVYPTHAVELARQAAEDGYELIIAAGGDGTVHEVVNGIMQVAASKRPKLGNHTSRLRKRFFLRCRRGFSTRSCNSASIHR